MENNTTKTKGYIKLSEEQWAAKKAATAIKQEAARSEARARMESARAKAFQEALKGFKGQTKEIPENPGYIAFDDGRIWSMKGRKFLKTSNHELGYLFIGKFTIQGKKSFRLIHRMIAHTFLPNPENFPEINHKDGNKHNNHVSNLEWCDRQHNMQHAVCMGLWDSETRYKLNLQMAREIKKRYEVGGVTHQDLSKEYGVCRSAIGNVITGKSWKAA